MDCRCRPDCWFSPDRAYGKCIRQAASGKVEITFGGSHLLKTSVCAEWGQGLPIPGRAWTDAFVTHRANDRPDGILTQSSKLRRQPELAEVVCKRAIPDAADNNFLMASPFAPPTVELCRCWCRRRKVAPPRLAGTGSLWLVAQIDWHACSWSTQCAPMPPRKAALGPSWLYRPAAVAVYGPLGGLPLLHRGLEPHPVCGAPLLTSSAFVNDIATTRPEADVWTTAQVMTGMAARPGRVAQTGLDAVLQTRDDAGDMPSLGVTTCSDKSAAMAPALGD